MFKFSLLILFVLIVGNHLYSQQAPKTQEELEIYLKTLQKRADSMRNAMGVPNNNAGDIKTTGNTSSNPNVPKGGDDLDKLKLPPKDSVRLRNIPRKNLSLTELRTYITDLHKQICKKLPADLVASANAIAQKLGNDPASLETAAIAALNSGSVEEAIVLITKSATLTNDGILLSNTGGILQAAGLHDRAVVILRTVVQHSPNNAIALNNLGQAYTGLGQQDSALHYFSRCLQLSPEHPEANATAGIIEYKRGNREKAVVHFENSIKGSFNIAAYTGLKQIRKEKCRITPLIKPKVELPEYFNQFKFKFPSQCRNVLQAKQSEEELKAFREFISAAINRYQKMEKDAEKQRSKKTPEQMNKEIMDKAKSGKPIMRPFQVLGGIMEAEALLKYQDDKSELEYFNKTNRQQYQQLEQNYKKEFAQLMKKYENLDDDCCGEGNVSCCEDRQFCIESNKLKNKYLEQFAQLNEEWQSRNLNVEMQYLDDLLYWGFFAAFDRDDYRVRFYQRVVSYLQMINRHALVYILKPCDETEPDEIKGPEEKELKEMDCPTSLSLKLGVVKAEMNCEEFSFRVGQGVMFKYDHNYRTQQSTWTLGVGEETDNLQVGKFGEIDTKLGMALFLSFDKAGNVMDGGISAQMKTTGSLGFDNTLKLKFKESVGWRLGYNSGLTMEEGRVKNWIDETFGPPKETQTNKNVKPYKPN